jgi:hypothetical protein
MSALGTKWCQLCTSSSQFRSSSKLCLGDQVWSQIMLRSPDPHPDTLFWHSFY